MDNQIRNNSNVEKNFLNRKSKDQILNYVFKFQTEKLVIDLDQSQRNKSIHYILTMFKMNVVDMRVSCVVSNTVLADPITVYN